MAKIAYEVIKGQPPRNVRFVKAEYEPKADERIIDAEALPAFEMGSAWDGEKYAFDRETWLNQTVRPLRDALLTASDGLMLVDTYKLMDATTAHAWEKYRQDLRDLPATIDHDDPVWPTPPDARIGKGMAS